MEQVDFHLSYNNYTVVYVVTGMSMLKVVNKNVDSPLNKNSMWIVHQTKIVNSK